MTASFHLPLQWKFIGIAAGAVLLFTSVFGFLAASRNQAVLQASTEKQGKVLAQTVAALIINELIYEKLGLVEEGGLIDNYLRELYSRRELDYLYLAVLDEQQRVISHSDFREYSKTYQDLFFDFSKNADVVVRKTVSARGVKALEFAAPLAIGGKNWGVFLFAVSLENVQRETRAMLVEIWAVAGVGLLCGFILIFFLSRRFIQPITALASAMQQVGLDAHERQPVRVTGHDELSLLAESFNGMIARLDRADEKMKTAHEKLLQSEKLATLGILSSSVAHRINNPLGGLQNCIAMLRRQGNDDAFRREYLDLMQEGVESIEQTVSQLLWTAGKRRGEESRAHIATVFNSVMRLVDYRIKRTAITLMADITDNLFVRVPPHDLNQILVNLMINAIQAMPAGGQLHFTARTAGGYVMLTLTDSGIGIPAGELHKIFDLFYTSKKPDEGTGLGLWMTYELVQRNKGEIRAESTVGEGTTFTITFTEAS